MERSKIKIVKLVAIVVVLAISLFSIIFISAALFNEVFSSSTFGFFNQTENTSGTGIRLPASVLSMDFNQPPENNTDGNVTYVQDNSIYNNWGTLK